MAIVIRPNSVVRLNGLQVSKQGGFIQIKPVGNRSEVGAAERKFQIDFNPWLAFEQVRYGLNSPNLEFLVGVELEFHYLRFSAVIIFSNSLIKGGRSAVTICQRMSKSTSS